MASASPSSMDMLVSIKVILDGTTRRFKRPLGDLGVKSLETQVRHSRKATFYSLPLPHGGPNGFDFKTFFKTF